MRDVAHWRLHEDEAHPPGIAGSGADELPKAVRKLSRDISRYAESKIKREHDLACDQALRAIDGLRVIKDLEPAAPKKTHHKGGAFHRGLV
jgi:hypothetical protein